jgi:hypothetical protein
VFGEEEERKRGREGGREGGERETKSKEREGRAKKVGCV